MAETQSTSPTPQDMHWGISYRREDLQDVKQDMRDFRKDVAQQFADQRKEVAQQFADVRRDIRHNLIITTGLLGLFATIVIAFIEYRLPGG